MIVFRHADPRRPFLWESPDQPGARWHEEGRGPVQYFSGTPDAAWAEFLRHEEILDPEDVAGIRRAVWAVEIPDDGYGRPRLSRATMTGGTETYERCRREADRLRSRGVERFVTPSAAIRTGSSSGWRVDGGLLLGPSRSQHSYVVFGRAPGLVGWAACAEGRPRPDLLDRVNPL